MLFKNFRIVTTLRILMIVALTFFLMYLLFQTRLNALAGIVLILIIVQSISLIKYVEKTNRDLSRFLDAIKYEDFTQIFTGAGLGRSFRELKDAFNQVLRKFQKARAETEEHHRYLQTVVQHIGIGLIAFEENGDVQLINTAAKRLLKVHHLKNIRKLKSFSPELVDLLYQVKPGGKSLIKINRNGELLQLAIYPTKFIMRNTNFTLISLQNIQPELEEQEMEAWQNLIRVLTHEIMNSITPIASLASTVNDIVAENSVDDEKQKSYDSETISDIRVAAKTIEKRSQGLLNFVQSYRKLYRIPKPNFQIFRISSLFERIEKLLSSQLKDAQIDFKSSVDPETLELTADPEMIEQVLINLIMNAIAALKKQQNRKIELLARLNGSGRVIIQVSDNGPGINEDIIDKIFIPFFTTKQEGSGIGLSLSRQIMRLHRGNISVNSNPGVETVFTLRF